MALRTSVLTQVLKYDVAFSFLAQDLGVAQDLESRLTPGLNTFVYARRKEELLGRDGMDSFSEVFRRDARLSVVLFREGWGHTPWTAFEETAIKSRALETRFSSMMVVRLDDSEMPTWIPSHQLYVSQGSDTRPEMAAVIRARAQEQGAVVKKLSASEIALKKSRDEYLREAREQRARSHKAPEEIRQELGVLYGEILRIVAEIKAGDANFDIAAAAHNDSCVISSSRQSASLILYPIGNTLRDLVLRENRWKGPHGLPSPSNPQPGGPHHLGATHYRPVISSDDAWVWQWEPSVDDGGVIFLNTRDELHRSADLAEQIVKNHVERIFD